MKERIKMKDGRLLQGITGGSENGLLFLFWPEELTKDETGQLREGEYFERSLGVLCEKIPAHKIEIIFGPEVEEESDEFQIEGTEDSRLLMDDGRIYQGKKGGSEGSFFYIFNPLELTEDKTGELGEDQYWEKSLGVLYIKVPLAEIKLPIYWTGV